MEVQELLQEFRSQAEKVEEILKSYSFGSDASETVTKKFTSRLKYESGGYEELSEMIVLLEKLNKAPQTIAPPLPHRYAAAARNIPRPIGQRTSQPVSMPEEDEPLVDSTSPSLPPPPSDMETQEVQQNIIDHRSGTSYHHRRPVENWIACSERLQPVGSRSVEDEILGIVIIARQVRMKSDMRRST